MHLWYNIGLGAFPQKRRLYRRMGKKDNHKQDLRGLFERFCETKEAEN